jgi:hypothetical protein
MGVVVDAFALFHNGAATRGCVLTLTKQRINSSSSSAAADNTGCGLFMSTTDASSQKSENNNIDNDNSSIMSRRRRSLLTETTTAAATALVVALLLSTAAYSQEAVAEDTVGGGPEVRGIPVTPFNGLMFNYRGFDYGGLTADQVSNVVNEPSVSYKEFMDKLKAGDVEFVEFMAPDGDAAYATFKKSSSNNNNQPIRIGEGTLRTTCVHIFFSSVCCCCCVVFFFSLIVLLYLVIIIIVVVVVIIVISDIYYIGYPIEQHDGWSSPAFAIRAVKNAGVPFKFTVPALSKYHS